MAMHTNTATAALPAIPMAQLSPIMREAVDRYLESVRAVRDVDAADELRLDYLVDVRHAAGSVIANVKAANLADLTAKVIIGTFEAEPANEVGEPDSLAVSSDGFLCDLGFQLSVAACHDAARLLAPKHCTATRDGESARALLAELLDDRRGGDQRGPGWNKLDELHASIVKGSDHGPEVAVERLLVALLTSGERWLERAIADGDFATIEAREEELDWPQRAIVAAIRAIGWPKPEAPRGFAAELESLAT